jgi:DNA polymerase-1
MWRVYKHTIEAVQPQQVYNFIYDNDVIGFDIETTGLSYIDHDVVALGIGNYNEQYIVVDNIGDVMRAALLHTKCVIHNAMFDLSFAAYKYNIPVSQADIIDTLQVDLQLTNGEDISHNYKTLVYKYLGEKIDKTEQTTFRSKDLTKEQILYLANDVKYLIPLAAKQLQLYDSFVSQGILSTKLFNTCNRIVSTMAHITTKGTRFDSNRHAQIIEEWKHKEQETAEQLSKWVNTPTNFNSVKQLLELFHTLDSSVRSTSKPALQKYLLKGSNQDLKILIKLLLEHRKYNKLLSTYGTRFNSYVHDGRVRTLLSTGTVSGRFRSSDVREEKGVSKAGNTTYRKLNRFANLQNIPTNEFKECFVPDEGEDMVTIDLDGCELRIIAAMSQDPILLAGVAGHIDLHSELATLSYRIIYDNPDFQVTNKMPERKRHKPALFAMLYGGKAQRISEVLNIPLATAKKVWSALREKLNVAFDFLDQYVKTALANGVAIANNVTKKAYFLTSYQEYKDNGIQYPLLYRLTKRLYNVPPQTTNADMINDCLIEVNQYFMTLGMNFNIRMAVYDEIVYTRPKNCAHIDDEVIAIIKKCCNNYLSDNVHMEVSINVDKYWTK